MSKFFHFRQNNSGGYFIFDKIAGIAHHTIVEASDGDEAIATAERIGLYFDGVDGGRDCPCCGSRWSTPWSMEGKDTPQIYGMDVNEVAEQDPRDCYAIHYMDKAMVWLGNENPQR